MRVTITHEGRGARPFAIWIEDAPDVLRRVAACADEARAVALRFALAPGRVTPEQLAQRERGAA